MTEGLWRDLVVAYTSYASILRDFLSLPQDERVTAMHRAISGEDKIIAIAILPFLPAADKLKLFESLLILATKSHGLSASVQREILQLPKEWVIEHIETYIDTILSVGTYDEYRRALELYTKLDSDLTKRLAERAINHPDIDVQEAGHDFMSKLVGPNA